MGETLIGSPNAKVFEAMEEEHCYSRDSNMEWTTGNYGITTTPKVEWGFVVTPGDSTRKLEALGACSALSSLQDWPQEQMLLDAIKAGKKGSGVVIKMKLKERKNEQTTLLSAII